MEPILCFNGCGFFGSADTRNLCSKCYEAYLKTEIIQKTLSSISAVDPKVLDENDTVSDLTVKMEGLKVESVKNRCKCCKKKVGLTGFKCRCGGLFCGRHRMPEQHTCHSDYKTFNPNDPAGNPRLPLIVADKLKSRV